MTDNDILAEEGFARCVQFHGHVCPGLAIGYRAALAGLDRLQAERAADEEIVAIVQTDACSVDAVQVITGCTFGKGNLIYRNYGKHVYTLAARSDNSGVRVALKPPAMELSERHRALIRKLQTGSASADEREEFHSMHMEKTRKILVMDLERLFTIRTADVDIPAKALIEPSTVCDHCGEPAMPSKMERVGGRWLCRECA